MDLLFSVILPTFNRAYVLWRAISSVLEQTEPRWELIVVNDGSTDCTERLLEEFQDPRINVLSTENRGASAARNLGLAVAQAPYVAYLDSDNTWHPAFLAVMHEAIQKHPEAVLWYCGANTTFWERSERGTWRVIFRSTGAVQPLTAERIWQLGGVDTNCMVHPRTVAEEVGGWDEQCWWLEDWDFFLRIFLKHPAAIQPVSYTLVEYRQVHGTGADGICAEARESKKREVIGRQYLLAKWQHHPEFAAAEKLSRTEEALPLLRGDPV